jgi:hypothetical protein
LKEDNVEQKKQGRARPAPRGSDRRSASPNEPGVVPEPHLNLSSAGGLTELPDGSTTPEAVSENDSGRSVPTSDAVPDSTSEEGQTSEDRIPFVASCLVACVVCTVLWAAVLLSVWYLMS